MNVLQKIEFELERERDHLEEMKKVVDTPTPFLTGDNSRFIMKGKKEFINRKKVKDQKQIITNLEIQLTNAKKEKQAGAVQS